MTKKWKTDLFCYGLPWQQVATERRQWQRQNDKNGKRQWMKYIPMCCHCEPVRVWQSMENKKQQRQRPDCHENTPNFYGMTNDKDNNQIIFLLQVYLFYYLLKFLHNKCIFRKQLHYPNRFSRSKQIHCLYLKLFFQKPFPRQY